MSLDLLDTSSSNGRTLGRWLFSWCAVVGRRALWVSGDGSRPSPVPYRVLRAMIVPGDAVPDFPPRRVADAARRSLPAGSSRCRRWDVRERPFSAGRSGRRSATPASRRLLLTALPCQPLTALSRRDPRRDLFRRPRNLVSGGGVAECALLETKREIKVAVAIGSRGRDIADARCAGEAEFEHHRRTRQRHRRV